MDFDGNDAVARRIQASGDRIAYGKDNDLYFFNQPVEEILGGAKVRVRGREMGMYASYSYLGLIGHPRINEAARRAVDKFGTGTNGVRTLAGTLTLHEELEETIALLDVLPRPEVSPALEADLVEAFRRRGRRVR